MWLGAVQMYSVRAVGSAEHACERAGMTSL